MSDGCILHVEDDANDVFFLQHAFKEVGITTPVQVAADGEMAVAYLAGEGHFADRLQYPLPCLTLLDLKLPGKSGLEVLAWIRAQSRLKTLVVIVLTASEQVEDVKGAYELGANAYLVKPPGIPERLQIAQFLNGWLRHNRFAPF